MTELDLDMLELQGFECDGIHIDKYIQGFESLIQKQKQYGRTLNIQGVESYTITVNQLNNITQTPMHGMEGFISGTIKHIWDMIKNFALRIWNFFFGKEEKAKKELSKAEKSYNMMVTVGKYDGPVQTLLDEIKVSFISGKITNTLEKLLEKNEMESFNKEMSRFKSLKEDERRSKVSEMKYNPQIDMTSLSKGMISKALTKLDTLTEKWNETRQIASEVKFEKVGKFDLPKYYSGIKELVGFINDLRTEFRNVEADGNLSYLGTYFKRFINSYVNFISLLEELTSLVNKEKDKKEYDETDLKNINTLMTGYSKINTPAYEIIAMFNKFKEHTVKSTVDGFFKKLK